MPGKQPANLIATGSMVHRTAYVARAMDPKLFLPTCRRAGDDAMWMLENLLELPGTAEEASFFKDGCMAERLTLLVYQRAQASWLTRAGRFRMPSSEGRRMYVSVGSLVATLLVVLADLSGNLGEEVRRNIPESDFEASIWRGERSPRRWEGHRRGDGRSSAEDLEGQGIPP